MTDSTNLLASVIAAGEGRIVGKIRMQKVVYLLEEIGLGQGFRFSYYHYGPYSQDLAEALDYAELVDRRIQTNDTETSTGLNFVTYSLNANENKNFSKVGRLDFNEAKRLVHIMTKERSIVIEIAATIHWLKVKEKVSDWKSELLRRKTTKAKPEFIERALGLLSEIGIAV